MPHSSNRPGDEERLTPVLERNIETLSGTRRRAQERRTLSGRVADAITGFAGSMSFVYMHLLIYGGWLLVNSGWVPITKPWDPFPFVMLAMIASVEAIFLSTFILISQNAMQRMSNRQAELDLQISLLAEHELTQAIQMLDGIAEKLGVERPNHHDLAASKRDVDPEKVVKAIDDAEERL